MSLTTQELHQQLFEAVEKGDITQLKLLIEPPLTYDTVVYFLFF